MNAHIPQSYEAATELAEIAAVPHQIVTPRHAKPLIGIVQDTLVGSYRITRPQVEFTRREFMNMMMWNKRFEGVVPKAARGAAAATTDAPATAPPRWTGQQVLSQLMPPINLEMGNDQYKDNKIKENLVKIREGEVLQGIFTKDIFSKPSKGIVHTTFRDYGSKDTVNFIDSMQNTVEQFLVYNGFSVGISDLIADEETRKQMEEVVKKRKEAIEKILLQIHLDLFDNNTGKSNQQEFEDKVFAELNKATEESGKIGLGSLADENRLVAMVRAGSKGSTINISQMMACVGQQAPEGKRIPYGFSDRTLPHYKKYDDGAEARGFVESSFIKGLTPQEFFFHAMSGREGLIDTAVKSVTGDTEIVVMEDGITKTVRIGDWIDARLEGSPDAVEHFPEEADLEMLQLVKTTYIPSVTPAGKVVWGKVAAVTRHDPGDQLYRVETLGGRSVIVTASKSLLIWNPVTKLFENKNTPDVQPGECMPVTMRLAEPPQLTESIAMANYLSPYEYIYGTEFHAAEKGVDAAMVDREHIPSGWWNANNGVAFKLPYGKKALFTRALSRSKMDNIQPGYVYPFTTNRSGARLPDKFVLDKANGIFLGLFLAEGNVDVRAGSVAITNNSPEVRQFVHDWFETLRIKSSEETRLNAIGGVTTTVRGYSKVLAKFLDELCGHGAAAKRVPAQAFTAPLEFVKGLLNGYISGDGTVTRNSVEAGSASKALTEGIVMLLSRLGVFAKVFETQLTSNNLGTEAIQPSYRWSVRAQWASQLAGLIELLDAQKEEKLVAMEPSEAHRNFPFQNDCVLDEITSIEPISPDAYPKMYDLTVPDTFTFGLANGLQVYDTADTGYIQRQLVKAMEDLTVQYDGTVRDSRMNVVQFRYGEDGVNATKIESASLGISKLSDVEIRRDYGMDGADVGSVLAEGTLRGEDAAALSSFAAQVLEDRKMLVEGINKSRQDTALYAPVNIERILTNVATSFRLDTSPAGKTDLTPSYVLAGIERLIQKTQPYHKLWAAVLRFYLAPHKLILKERFTRKAFDTACEMILVKNWQGWAQPGEQVGIIAAQSIGEPSTQMTLNSVDWDTRILIAKDGAIQSPEIGDFVDRYLKTCDPGKVQHLANGQIYIPLEDGHNWQAVSCGEDGVMKWTKLEAITRHPVVNEDGTDTILKVTTASGRIVKATKGKSFLTRGADGRVQDLAGVDLRVGDVLPIAATLATEQLPPVTTLSLRGILSPAEYMYGTDVQKALQCMEEADATGDRHWFTSNQGATFTVPYGRSDAFRDAFQHQRNSNATAIAAGYVYPKHTRPDASQIPAEIVLTAEFGFFAGAYIAEGSANATQVNITNNDVTYLARVKALMDAWNVGTHLISEKRQAKKSGITGTTTSLVIHSTLLAKVMTDVFGRVSHEKTLPDWAMQAPREFLVGLLDGYVSGDGTVAKRDGVVKVSSVSKGLITRMQSLLAGRFGIFTVQHSYTPEKGVFDSVREQHVLTLQPKGSQAFARAVQLTVREKQARLVEHFLGADARERVSYRESTADVIWDAVTAIEEVRPMGEGWVYDLTVEETRNFTSLDCVVLKDTFHLAGVAAKSNVTRGVPRLKELLKVTQNPKAISLTVTLKPEFRDSKEKARKVAQDLELTLLKDITVKAAIYYDPDESDSVLAEDRDLLKFYKAFEEEVDPSTGALKERFGEEGAEGPEGAGAAAAAAEKQVWSRLMLRLELDRERMFQKNISMDDIAFVLRTKFGEAINLIYSDYNSQRLVMRIRIPPVGADEGGEQKATDAKTFEQLDDLIALKKLQNRLLTGIVIRGVPGIKAVTFRQDKDVVEYNQQEGTYKQLTQYVLDTDGTNFLSVMNHPFVDGLKLTSSHVHDIYENLGIEATRATLLQEITTLFEEAGVNNRHLGLLCDVMTRAGRLMSVDRYGINKMDIGPLAKASFEETEKILLRAALFGEVDPVTGISANIMMGQPIRGGTGFFDVLLDESAFMNLQKGLPPLGEEEEEEEPDAPTQEQINAELYEDEADVCSTARLRMNVGMPKSAVLMEEADVEIAILDKEDGSDEE